MHSIVLLFVIFPLFLAYGENKSICGINDDRSLSQNSRIGRIQKFDAKSGCTITMIGRTCAITAGHCDKSFINAHFNVPLSDEKGNIVESLERDIYPVNQDSIVLEDEGKGQDWAVLRLGTNKITGNFPGDMQGMYKVHWRKPALGKSVTVTGFGADRDPLEQKRNYAQQTHRGRISAFEGNNLRHRVDTWGGSSGSPLIYDNTQKIIGVHTHGGCKEDDSGANSATTFWK